MMKQMFRFISLYLLFVVLAFCVLASLTLSVARSEPFLVCDPQTNVTHYIVTLDGLETIVAAVTVDINSVRLFYDLEGVSSGEHQVTVKAKNEWGESVAVPFAFIKALPVAPDHLLIE